MLFVTSALTPRSTHLLLLQLGVLLDFGLCAFFFDLESPAPSPFSLSALIGNFWVGLYSAIISLLPMSVVSLTFLGASHKRLRTAPD